MLLQLDDRHRVITDTSKQNYIMERLDIITDRKTKATREDWVVVGYFGGNLTSLLKRYKNEVLIHSDLSTLHDVLDKLNEVDRTIDRVVKKENIKLGDNNE